MEAASRTHVALEFVGSTRPAQSESAAPGDLCPDPPVEILECSNDLRSRRGLKLCPFLTTESGSLNFPFDPADLVIQVLNLRFPVSLTLHCVLHLSEH